MADARGDPHPTASPTTILLVEDEVLIRTLLAEELRSAGYRVIEASNGIEAQDVLAAVHQPSVVITDIRMPGSVNGVELARLVRSTYPLAKVVVTSADPTLLRGVEYDNFLLKPFAPTVLLTLIATLLGRNAE